MCHSGEEMMPLSQKKYQRTQKTKDEFRKQALIEMTPYLTLVSPQMISFPMIITSLLIYEGRVFDQTVFRGRNLLIMSNC